MSKKKSILLIVLALIVGIAVGAGVTFGMCHSTLTGTVTDSDIDETSIINEARSVTERFQEQIEQLEDEFKDYQASESDLPLDFMEEFSNLNYRWIIIDDAMRDVDDDAVQEKWSEVTNEWAEISAEIDNYMGWNEKS